jgi:anti-anti-sigma regulatory factor
MSKPGSRAKKPAGTPDASAPKRARKATSGKTVAPATEPVPDCPFVLPQDLRIGSAADVHAGLLARAGDVALDGESVAKVDAAGVQAVLAALIQFSRSGGSWRWHNPSAVLKQGIAVLGLGESLRLP